MYKKKNAFTLIELFVVVIIIGIIFSIAIPFFLRAKDKENKKNFDTVTLKIKDENEKNKLIENNKIKYIQPQIIYSNIKVNLSNTNYIKGLDVYSLFNAEFNGEFEVKNNEKDIKNIKLIFNLPNNLTQINEVKLKIKDKNNNFIEQEDFFYENNNIVKYLILNYKESTIIRLSYTAQGTDKYIFESNSNTKYKYFNAEILINGASSEFIPKNSLQPTKIEENKLIWKYSNLLTNGKIIVELPNTTSPIGRIIFFFKLAGIAVLLFGVGLIYISSLDKPERLDSFRLGHFLLLAITYSLFFINYVLISLGKDINPFLSMIISALLSLPLLVLHVSKVWGINFALSKILPLAIFTLSLVITGVYGGDEKRYIFLGFTIFTLLFIIFTYEKSLNKRKIYLDSKNKKLDLENTTLVSNNIEEHCFCNLCGKKSDKSKFCPHCGNMKNINLKCESCNHNSNIPIALIEDKFLEKDIFCSKCGNKYIYYLKIYKGQNI